MTVLIAFIAADNMLWRVAALTGAFTFVGITGDIRRDLFRHMTGHSPTFFSDRQPGTLASRITATSNAIFTVENMFVFNVMPPTRRGLRVDRLHRHASTSPWRRSWPASSPRSSC